MIAYCRQAIGRVLGFALAVGIMTASQSTLADNHAKLAAKVAIDPAARTMAVSASLLMEARGEVTFLLGAPFRIDKVTVSGRQALRARDGDVFIVDFGPGDGRKSLDISYQATLAPIPKGGRPNRVAGAISGPNGAFVPASALWLPYNASLRFHYEIAVQTPPGQKAVMPGLLVSEDEDTKGYRAQFRSEQLADSLPLFAGPWEITEITDDQGTLIRSYFDPSVADQAEDYLQYSKDYLALYRDWVGAYPFSAFHIVAGPVPVGLGYRNLTYIGSRVLNLPFIKRTSLGHEVLHNWWGNGVYPVYEQGNWAEGLTTFMADYTYALQQSDEAAQTMRLQWLRDYAALPPERDKPAKAFTAKTHGADQVVGYNKVAFFFHMLRNRIGEPAFNKAIGAFWDSWQFRRAGWNDIKVAMEQASGEDLAGFFAQWLDQPGAPDLTLRVADFHDDGGLTLALDQGDSSFDLDIPVRLTTKSGHRDVIWRMDQRMAERTFRLNEPITGFAIDPTFDLFRRLDPLESPPILRDVMLRKDVDLVIMAEGLGWGETAMSLAQRMSDGRVLSVPSLRGVATIAIVTQSQVAELVTSGTIPTPPQSLADSELTAKVWAARRNLKDNDTVPIVVIAVRDVEALAALQRGLPHYGRRGYVGFNGTKAELKGAWPAQGGPLRGVRPSHTAR